ncbi:zinc finger MYM-type protein 1-like [Aphis craccivora]|uniref:Zinc finger MYM-type protein 1-like n=1 Tax=Aphis craccivora TaxID=307492 RepID=A0A6G0W9F5_APHCR|nr:zinc finger MYM-type protein 1-like [Aphis craccivora]
MSSTDLAFGLTRGAAHRSRPKCSPLVVAAKYYSISDDSTPDLSHVNQLTSIVLLVKDRKPIEIFLQFLPIEQHRAQYIIYGFKLFGKP